MATPTTATTAPAPTTATTSPITTTATTATTPTTAARAATQPRTTDALLTAAQLAAKLQGSELLDGFGQGFSFDLGEVTAPQRAGDAWIVQWDTDPAETDPQDLEMMLFDSHEEALQFSVDSTPPELTYYDLTSPPGARCTTPGADDAYICDWVDGQVEMICPGYGYQQQCTGFFLDGQNRL